MKISDVSAKLVGQAGELAILREQYIPQAYLDHLADARFNSVSSPTGDLHRICSVPVGLVEKWKREGFDIHTATIPEIIRRLRLEGYDRLICTAKRFG